ncbi:MAG: hypothetical protein Q9165_001302 [Trypethelium subeluteriae]
MRPEYSIFWVSALSSESYQQACDEILRELQRSGRFGEASVADADTKQLIQSYLSSKKAGKWLLVLDNADDEELLYNHDAEQSQGMANYLPQSEDGLILITTRQQEIAVSLAGSNVIELLEMDQDERRQMFEQRLVRRALPNDEPTLNELLDELNSIPLAMTQAASYININKITLLQYLKLIRNTEQDLASLITREFRDDTRYAKSANAIARTWAVSFEQLRRHDAAAMELFSFMSCMEPKAIPRSILPVLQSEERMTSAIGTLCAYSFIAARGDNDMYDIHSLVHAAKKIWIKDNGLAVQVTAQAIDHLADVFPYVEFETSPVWRLYLPHAARLCQQGQEIETERRSWLCHMLGSCFHHDGRAKEAIAWMKEACSWMEKYLEEDHPKRLVTQNALAASYRHNGQISESIQLLEHIIAIRERTLTEDHPDRLTSQYELAASYHSNGQILASIQLLEHIITIRERTLIEDHPDRLTSQHELAGAYRANGQISESIQLLEHIITIRERTLTEDHPDRLASQHELARAYHANGQVMEAVQLLEHVVTVRKRPAKDHPDQLNSQHGLAAPYLANVQVVKAVQLLEHVVVKRDRLAEDHPDRLASQHALAGAYLANGEVVEAVQLLEHVVAKRDRLAEDHPDRLASQHELASAYCANKQVAEAVQLLEYVVAKRDRLAEDHPERLASQHELARVYHANGQELKAVRLLEHVVTVSSMKFRQDHPNRLTSERLLAKFHMESRNGSQESQGTTSPNPPQASYRWSSVRSRKRLVVVRRVMRWAGTTIGGILRLKGKGFH